MRNLVGIAMCVFIKQKVNEHVTDIMGGELGVGVFGVMVRIGKQLFSATMTAACAKRNGATGSVARWRPEVDLAGVTRAWRRQSFSRLHVHHNLTKSLCIGGSCIILCVRDRECACARRPGLPRACHYG